jgi:oligopeptide transport system substrate-binding protein
VRSDGRRLLGAAGLLGALLAGALALGSRAALPRADFAFCNQDEISSLDPAIATGVPEGRVLSALFEGLTRPDPATGDPLPGMATAWECSEDGLTWRFTIRQDSLWTDGDRVTAHDFDWSLRRFLRAGTAAPYAYLLWFVAGAEAYSGAPADGPPPDEASLGIEAPSDTELVLRLARPCPCLPRLLAYYPLAPVKRSCVERWGRAWNAAEHIVTNGPFRLVERRVRDRLRLERFDGYWGRDDVQLRTIDAYAANGITTQLNMYLTGQVDWMLKPPTGLYEAILPRPDAHVGAQSGMTFFRFNVTRPPFDDRRVREALTLALDREGLARDVMRGGERGAVSYVPQGMPDYTAATLPPPDPARARALLADAGFPGGAGFPSFELLYPNNEVTRDFCEACAAQWRDVLGLQPRLANQAWKVYLDSQKDLRYDVSWGSWIADYLDVGTFLEVFLSGSGNNRTGWRDAEYDALVGLAGASPDLATRAGLFQRAEQRLLDDFPIAPVYQRINLNLVAPRVRGFSDNLLDVHPLRDLSVNGPP